MSKVVNKEGIRPGVIHRIALENFVTYKQVVLFPGPSLNMIVGPNGTGKSTFVCAIILGLCGKTSVIGRAKKISEYVRSGCEQASIEIELYQAPGQRNVIITRNFNLQDVSTWCIDSKSVRERQVQDLIATLNIQVDNLCQLLPQDRVQDFSKMNPQDLLRSTLSAVGGHESVVQLDELIESRNKQRGLSTKLQNNAQLLQEQERLNERLKVLIDAMQQRKDIERQIEVCEKKKLWLEYQELRERVIEYTNDKKKAVKLVNTHKSKMDPLQKLIDKAKSGISKVEQQKLMAGREIHTLRDKAKEIIDGVRNHEYTLKDIETSLQEKMERHRNREQELIEAKAKLDKLKTDKQRLEEKVGDDTRVKMEMAEITKALSKTNAAMDVLKKQKLEVQYDLENNVVPQMRLYQNKIRNLEDVDNKRLEVLRNYSEDAYKAVMWLRQNKDMFQEPVYEPMVLEINFTDSKFARYLENTVSARDLVAFTFESSRDMNLFLKKVRQEGGLKRVNAICSQGGRVNVQKNNIQQISYLGFYTYLVDTITAPDAIIRYLCKNYNIHRIPIGNDHTYNNSGSVPANITYFFTENHRFTIRVSAYSGAKSSSTNEIRGARLLANTVDAEQVDNYTRQLSSFEQRAQSHQSKIQTLNEKIQTIEVSLNELNVKRRNINDGVEKVRTISAQIRIQNKKVEDIENEPSLNVEQERVRCKRKQRDIVMKQCSMHRELAELMKSLQARQLNGDMWKLFVAGCTLVAALSVGGAASYPTVLLHQLRSNETSIHIDFDTASWIGSIHGLAGIPSMLLPNIMQWRGRKIAFIAACLVTVLGWITAFTAESAAALLVAESFHGLGTNSVIVTSYLIICEMISPEYRHAYMQMYAVLQTFAMAMNGLMTQYVNWRTISVIMCAPMLIAIPIAFMWPESPYWLAINGEFDKCEETFSWLGGEADISKNELKGHLNSQKGNIYKEQSKMSCKRILSTITRRDFYLPSLHMFLLQYLFYWSGSYVILIYSVELIQRSTQNKNAAFFGGFITNLSLCFGIVTGIVLNRLFNKKTILLWFTSIGVVSMLCASLVTFLQSVDVLPKSSSLCLYCLILFMIANGVIVPIAFNIAIEIMPIKHRSIGGALIVACSCVLHYTSLKISPYLFLYIDLWATFICYTLNSLCCGLFIWKFVPETKNKSLQEIEDFYMYGGYKRRHVMDEYFEDLDQGEEMLAITKGKN